MPICSYFLLSLVASVPTFMAFSHKAESPELQRSPRARCFGSTGAPAQPSATDLNRHSYGTKFHIYSTGKWTLMQCDLRPTSKYHGSDIYLQHDTRPCTQSVCIFVYLFIYFREDRHRPRDMAKHFPNKFLTYLLGLMDSDEAMR